MGWNYIEDFANKLKSVFYLIADSLMVEHDFSITDFIPYIPWVIGLTGVYFAVRNYLRKSGLNIRGQFCISSRKDVEDKYVSSITLENFKDRSVIIFKVFLRVGANYYIELDDFEHEPKILKPYESYTSNYEPVDFYCVNMNRIQINKLLDSKKAKMNLVLSTSHGKYVVKEWIVRWDPVFDYFNNHMTTSIIPMRPKENVGYYGANVKYLAKLQAEDGYINTIPIYATDYNYPRFEKFRLTEYSLSSSEALQEFLIDQAINGKLQCVDIEVIDVSKLREDSYGHGFEKSFEAKYYSWVFYVVIGKLLTILSNIRLYFINRKNKRLTKHCTEQAGKCGVIHKEAMTLEEHKRYVRWQDHRVTQLSFTVNLFLGFAVASLAYAINIKLEGKPHGVAPIDTVLIWWAFSAACGCIATISKLLDYRYTARKIKDGGQLNTSMAKFCGRVTWGFFWVQTVAYAVGAIKFILGVISV